MKYVLKVALGFLAVWPGVLGAQSPVYSVSATAVDDTGEGEAFATYRIYAMPDTLKAIYVNTTDSLGAFSRTLPHAGDYRLTLHSVGRKPISRSFAVSAGAPVVNLGRLVFTTDAAVLKEVSVTAQRPLVTKEIDRVGYDVQADEDSKTNTVLEMLRKVPMVSVDADGTIKVNGSANFVVHKDGRPNQAFSSNGKEIFSAIPASMIKRIEVITEPGAKYDAEGVGAILNIVTMDNTAVSGVMGNAGLNSRSSNDFIPSAHLWLSAQINKVAFSLYGGGGYNTYRQGRGRQITEYTYKQSGNIYRFDSSSRSKSGYSWFGGEASYELDSLNLFNLEFNGFYYDSSNNSHGAASMTEADGTPIYSYNTRTKSPQSNFLNFDGSLNYEHRTHTKGETLTLSYALQTNKNVSREEWHYDNLENFPLGYDYSYTDYDLQLMEHTFQADWSRPVAGIHTIETGAKYVLRRNHSDNLQQYGEDAPGNHIAFTHLTNIGALYAQYSVRLGKWGLRAGLRYEFSRLKAEFGDEAPDFSSNLNDFVPSASASWQASSASSFTFNYAARINRPGIEYLNPVVRETPTSLSYGNPNLNSARHNSFKLTYMLIKPKFNLNVSAMYEFSNDGIVAESFVDEAGLINNTYANAGHMNQLRFDGFMQWSPGSKTQIMLNGGGGRTSYSQNGMRLARWGYRVFGRVQQQLPWKLSAQLGSFIMGTMPQSVYSYTSPGINGVYVMLGVRRSFLKEDRLTVSIDAHNPVGRSVRNFTTKSVNGDVIGPSTWRQYNQRSIGISVSYRFGSFNANVKKTSKKIVNDDLVGGSSNGQSQTQSQTGGM